MSACCMAICLTMTGFLSRSATPGVSCSAMPISSRCTRPGVGGRRIRRRCLLRCCSPSCFMGCRTARPNAVLGWICRGKQRLGCRSSIAGSRTCAWSSSVPGSSEHEMTGFLKDRMLAVAKRAGAIGHRRVVDSTGIADSVVTQDTVTLIRTAARLCLNRLAVIDPAVARAARWRVATQRLRPPWASRRSCGSRRRTSRADQRVVRRRHAIIDACTGIEDTELAQHVDCCGS